MAPGLELQSAHVERVAYQYDALEIPVVLPFQEGVGIVARTIAGQIGKGPL